MNILYATDNFPPPFSGHAIAVINMAVAMKMKGHDSAIIAPSTRGLKDYDDSLYSVTGTLKRGAASIKVYYLRSIPFIHGDNALKSIAVKSAFIKRILADFRPDIIHYNGWGPLCKKVFKSQQSIMNIPCSATCHGVPMHVTSRILPRNNIIQWLEKLIWKRMVQFYRRMDLVISPSKYIHGMLVKAGLVADKGIVLSNGIEIDEYCKYGKNKKVAIKRKYGLPVDNLLITYIGRLDPEKNIDTILSLMKHFMNNRKIFFVIAGAGKLRPKMEACARRQKYNFVLLNWLSHEELIDILGVSDIFFNPSPSESQSITTLEAMASFLPIVVADRGALVDLVEEGVNGYIFKYNDFNSCVEKLTFLLREETIREDFGKKSRQKVLYHDRAKIIEQLEKEYNNLGQTK